jgi:hypothetical protein
MSFANAELPLVAQTRPSWALATGRFGQIAADRVYRRLQIYCCLCLDG